MEEEQNQYLNSLLNPKTVAVIGASPSVKSWGGRVLKFLTDFQFQGTIYPINPKYQELYGIKAYSSIGQVPEDIDVMVIAIPAAAVPEIFRQAARASVRIKNAVILTAGFAERGNTQQEAELKELARITGTRILGPNCLGLINAGTKAILSSTQALLSGRLYEGPISIISHSGAFAGAIISQFADQHIGVRYVVSTGNEADYDMADFLNAFSHDEQTKIVVLFIEGIRDKDTFTQGLASLRAAGKVIIALKVGRTKAAAGIARSHTAKLAGSDAAFDAVFRKYSVIRASTMEELVGTASIFARFGLPKQRKVFALSPSGGTCGILADKFADYGLPLGTFSPEDQTAIDQTVQIGHAKNPLDFGSSRTRSIAGAFGDSLELIDHVRTCGVILIAFTTFPGIDDAAQELTQKLPHLAHPVVFLNSAGGSGITAGQITAAAGIPVFQSTSDALQILHNWLLYNPVPVIPSAAPQHDQASYYWVKNLLQVYHAAGRQTLTEYEAKPILAAYGIPVTQEFLAHTLEEAVTAASKLNYPLVLKIVSPDIAHKSESGGIVTNIRDEASLRSAYTDLLNRVHEKVPHAVISGVLVQQQANSGFEVFAGISPAVPFGHLITFGLGGIYVEAFHDTASRLVPLSNDDAQQLINETNISTILHGTRGQSGYDLSAITGMLKNLSRLAEDFADDIAEIDINPFIVFPEGQGGLALDALIILKEKEETP